VGMGRGGAGAVHHHLARGAVHGGADLLPPASPGQINHPLLQAAMEY
jgi:hypothetical protein